MTKEAKRLYTRKWYRENSAKRQAYRLANVEKIKVSRRAYRLRKGDDLKVARRHSMRKSTYGISQDEFEQMLADQGGCCAICKNREPVANRALAVDHDHKTGKVRQLLCSNCNRGLGCFRDDPKLLQTALEYQLRHNA